MTLHKEIIELLKANKKIIDELGDYCDINISVRDRHIELKPTKKIRSHRINKEQQ